MSARICNDVTQRNRRTNGEENSYIDRVDARCFGCDLADPSSPQFGKNRAVPDNRLRTESSEFNVLIERIVLVNDLIVGTLVHRR